MGRNSHRNSLAFTELVVRENGAFYSLCPEIDVASQGPTIAKAKRMLHEAVSGYLETCFDSNLPHLRPTPSTNDPRHAEPDNVVETFRIRVDVAAGAHDAR